MEYVKSILIMEKQTSRQSEHSITNKGVLKILKSKSTNNKSGKWKTNLEANNKQRKIKLVKPS